MDTTNDNAVTIYTRPLCGFCWAAKQILSKMDVTFTEVNCNNESSACAEVQARTGHRTVPMIFVGDHFVGGCDDLRRLVQRDELIPLIESEQQRTDT